MKKFFTLLSVMAAALTANAQTWQVSDADAAAGQIAAGTSLIQSRKAIVKTHFDATAGILKNEEGNPMTATIKGYPFKNFVQVRVDAAPTAAVPEGTDKGGSTPFIVEAKQDLNLTFYYRRQAVDGGFTAGDGKDLQCVNQEGIVKQKGDLTVDTDLGTGYGYCYQTYHLLAGNKYTVYGRGTTINMYGFDVEDYTAPVVDEPTEPVDETNALYAFDDPAVNAAGFSQISYKDGAALILSGNADKAWSKGSNITVNGQSVTTIKVSNGAQNTYVAPEGKYVTKATFYSYVNKDAEARTPYWKEVNGVDYTTIDGDGNIVPSAEAVIMHSYKDFENPDAISFDLGGVSEFTFTNTGEQVCFVLYVEFGAKAVVGGPVYSWESNGGEVAQFGGTIVNTGDERDNVNYANAWNDVTYYTICVRGKKANIDAQDGTANASRIELTLDGGFKAGDQIAITGYYNKGEEKTVTLYMLFPGNGVEIADNGPWYDIQTSASAPSTNVFEVPAEADGQQTLYMTRNSAGTNLFITKLQVIREGAAGIHEVKAEAKSNVMYNIYGQQVNVAKGIVIINGKKAIFR